MIKIAKAQLEDLAGIIAIEQDVFDTDSYPPFVVRQLFDISGDYFLVAKEKDKILGYALGGLNTKKQQGWVLSLGVHRDARGKGLGKQLTAQLIELLKAEYAEEIALTVYPDNTSAIKIYKDLGFVGETVLDNYFFDHEERVVMTLKISHQ
ncbi:GNAT family N-acetyltransferase [Subsaximicrobium wynnwilliamsii]|uniref:GNAT family N-acetyltransferase n=1 Tax=Subsaximicrobium wynnwilliamsii TaxID=291179 RepID=A0A5C6ZL48_9FLAO|nr:N-acetyltransferase [Subsaximicrobium wynnwilliamsii]TXD84878.1 GNAT family N-acetyltransferase [Subsaximicrobium wynnwilliamsii]TXD90549.1 GNAT family N-acetyltransferase [Subsaximicrobium wynnwilliamsii]TXE05024.1 GNAT family N-acetyltransferase [Subsaximicrobium wynnwilliamsii]